MKELTVSEWVNEIDVGLEYRRLYGLEDEWSSLEAMFYSVHPSSKNAGPNIIAATGDAVLSQLNVPVPAVVVKPKVPSAGTVSRVLESVDNSLIKDLKIGREVETSSLHAFLWGKGILKYGYDSEFGYSPEFVLGEDLGLSMTQFDIKGKRIEFGNTHPGMPWVKSCLPHDIVVPYGTINIDDAAWIAHRVVRHVEDIKADVKYSKKKELQPIMSMDDFTKSYQSVKKPYRVGNYDKYYKDSGKSDYCELWEIHDRRTGKIIVIATGHDKFLRNEIDMLQLNDLPFIAFNFIPNARTFWTTPDSFYLKPFQAELSDITSQASKQRRLGVLKFLYDEEAFDEAELLKILSPEVGVGAKVKSTGRDMRETIVPLTMPNNNPMLYNDAKYVEENARATVGFSRNQMGEYAGTGRRTATEALAVREASGVRMSRREKIIKDVYEDIVKGMNSVIFEFWKTPRWTEVSGTQGAQWIEFSGNLLKGDYSYSVDFAPEAPESQAQRRQLAMQLFQIFSQDPNIDKAQLITYIVNAFNDKELSDIFGGIENLPLQQNQGQSVQQPPTSNGQASPPKPQPNQSNGGMQ